MKISTISSQDVYYVQRASDFELFETSSCHHLQQGSYGLPFPTLRSSEPVRVIPKTNPSDLDLRIVRIAPSYYLYILIFVGRKVPIMLSNGNLRVVRKAQNVQEWLSFPNEKVKRESPAGENSS